MKPETVSVYFFVVIQFRDFKVELSTVMISLLRNHIFILQEKRCKETSYPLKCQISNIPMEYGCQVIKLWKQLTKTHEILMFVGLQKDAKQYCDATKLNCTHCVGH